MNSNMTGERLVQLIKSVEAASSLNNLKDSGDFLDNFRQILSEANVDEFTTSGQASPTNDEDYQDEMEFSPPLKSNSFISHIQMEKDPVEIRAQLINLVRRTPELYDKNDPRYKNNAHKGVLWSRIARDIGNGKKVREQWSYMRRKYEEEYHSRLSGNAPTPMDPTKRHLFTYDQLSFLEPYISTHPPNSVLTAARSASPNDRAPLSHQTSSDDAQSGRDSRNEANEEFNNSALASNLNQLLMQLAQHRSSTSVDDKAKSLGKAQKENEDDLNECIKRKRKIAEDPQAEIAALNASVLCLSRCLEEVLPKGGDDDCTIFGRQIANDLRQLPKKRRLSIRKQIADLLLQELSESVDDNNTHENQENTENEVSDKA